MFISFEFLVRSHCVEKIEAVVSSAKEAVSFANLLESTERVRAYKMYPYTPVDFGCAPNKNWLKLRENGFTQEDYLDEYLLTEIQLKDVSGDQFEQDTIRVNKILTKVKEQLNNKWHKRKIVLVKLNHEMSKIHDAKEGKFFTAKQENRLRTLRMRCVRLGYYGYKLIKRMDKYKTVN